MIGYTRVGVYSTIISGCDEIIVHVKWLRVFPEKRIVIG